MLTLQLLHRYYLSVLFFFLSRSLQWFKNVVLVAPPINPCMHPPTPPTPSAPVCYRARRKWETHFVEKKFEKKVEEAREMFSPFALYTKSLCFRNNPWWPGADCSCFFSSPLTLRFFFLLRGSVVANLTEVSNFKKTLKAIFCLCFCFVCFFPASL